MYSFDNLQNWSGQNQTSWITCSNVQIAYLYTHNLEHYHANQTDNRAVVYSNCDSKGEKIYHVRVRKLLGLAETNNVYFVIVEN